MTLTNLGTHVENFSSQASASKHFCKNGSAFLQVQWLLLELGREVNFLQVVAEKYTIPLTESILTKKNTQCQTLSWRKYMECDRRKRQAGNSSQDTTKQLLSTCLDTMSRTLKASGKNLSVLYYVQQKFIRLWQLNFLRILFTLSKVQLRARRMKNFSQLISPA